MNISSNFIFVISVDFEIEEDYWVIHEIYSNKVVTNYKIKNETRIFNNFSKIKKLVQSQYE